MKAGQEKLMCIFTEFGKVKQVRLTKEQNLNSSGRTHMKIIINSEETRDMDRK
jgi:hypothetical protein